MIASPAHAIVLCGGTSRRMGVADKTALPLVDGASVLDAVLTGLPAGWQVTCVGDSRPTSRPVTWTREDPPGGGPTAGIRAGLEACGELAEDAPVLVVAGDQPFAGAAGEELVEALCAADPQVDAVAAPAPRRASRPAATTQATAGTEHSGAPDGPPTDLPTGSPAPSDAPAPSLLLAAYRAGPLGRALAGDVHGRGVYATLGHLRVCVHERVGAELALDVDTPDDLHAARERARSEA